MKNKRIAIVGGGISGLSAAHRLLQLKQENDIPLDITLLEASQHLGGILGTYREDGFVMEAGAESFITEKPAALELAKSLGLESELIGTNPDQRFSYVLLNGKLRPIPPGFYLIAPGNISAFLKSDALSLTGKLRVLCDLFLPRREAADETVADFIRRRFGNECLIKIGQPMIGGIYGGDIEKLSLKETFPKFIQMEKQHRSIIKALMFQQTRKEKSGTSGPRYNLFMTFKNGLQTLIDALTREIEKDGSVSIRRQAKVSELLEQDNGWLLRLSDGDEMAFDVVLLALPVPQQADLLSHQFPELAEKIQSIPVTSSMTLNLIYDKTAFKKALHGFGFVVPEIENSSLVGCTFSSLKFLGRSDEKHVLLRAFVSPSLIEEPHELIVDKVHRELADLLSIEQRPKKTKLTVYRGVMPQYHVGHASLAEFIRENQPRDRGLFLTGNFFQGVGIPDCIRMARQEANDVFNYCGAREEVKRV